MIDRIIQFMATDPTLDAIEEFYLREVLPHDKRSISEILDQ